MLTLKAVTQIKAELEGAFEPLQCRVQVYNSGERLRFKVFDEDYAIACEIGDLSLQVLLDQGLLSELIQKARKQIRSRSGFKTDHVGW